MQGFYGKFNLKGNNINTKFDDFSYIDNNVELFVSEKQMKYQTEEFVVLFNGEIYNKSDNTILNPKFLLDLFIKYNDKLYDYINGNYTFVIYNIKKNELLISKDFIGSKPIFYYYDNKSFIFSTKINDIPENYQIKKEINENGLYQFFSMTYIPAPETIYKYIYKLKPGNNIIISKDNIKVNEFWKLDYNKDLLITDYDSCKKSLKDTLYKSVERRINYGGKIGTLMSGGIDSTVITGITSDILGSSIDAFTLIYDDKEISEEGKAKIAAKRYNCNHHLKLFTEDDFIDNLNDMVNNLDEPYGDYSYICSYAILNEAKKYVDVVFTGDGGDELFGGYVKYLIDYYSKKFNKIPNFIRKGFIKPSLKLLPNNSNLSRRVNKVVNYSEEDIFTQRKNMLCLGFKSNEIDLLFKNIRLNNSEVLKTIEEEYNSLPNAVDEITKAQWLDFKVVLDGDMLPKFDYASRITEIGSRASILDQEVVNLAYKIPSKYKLNGTDLKYVFKDTFSEFLPKELFFGEKHGFTFPLRNWLRNSMKTEFKKYINKEFLEEQNIFNFEYINLIYNNHLSMKESRTYELWCFYVFQKWYENNML